MQDKTDWNLKRNSPYNFSNREVAILNIVDMSFTWNRQWIVRHREVEQAKHMISRKQCQKSSPAPFGLKRSWRRHWTMAPNAKIIEMMETTLHLTRLLPSQRDAELGLLFLRSTTSCFLLRFQANGHAHNCRSMYSKTQYVHFRASFWSDLSSAGIRYFKVAKMVCFTILDSYWFARSIREDDARQLAKHLQNFLRTSCDV